MNRRNFFKFLSKGAAVAALASIPWLPKAKGKTIVGKDATVEIQNGEGWTDVGKITCSTHISGDGTMYISGNFADPNFIIDWQRDCWLVEHPISDHYLTQEEREFLDLIDDDGNFMLAGRGLAAGVLAADETADMMT